MEKFRAVIHLGDTDKVAERVQIEAEDLDAAYAELEARYGSGTVFSLAEEVRFVKP